MSKYELLLVLPGTLDDAQAKAKSEEIQELVRAHGSDVELHILGKNRLAYPIKHIRYGYFYTLVFSAEPTEVKNLEAQLSLSRELLRTIISHFNITLNATQRIVFSTDTLGLTTMVERTAPIAAMPARPEVVRAAKTEAEIPSTAERKLDQTSIDEISKKLDDLISGDVLPTT